MNATHQETHQELRVFMTSAKSGYDASGLFDGQGIVVLKGSVLSIEVTSDRLDAAKREKVITPAGILTEDTYFDSPSGAALFVCGRSANGWVEWKDASGQLLQQYRSSFDVQPHSITTYLPIRAETPSKGAGTNMVGLEGEEVSIETDALTEERNNAKANYQHLQTEYDQIQAQLPYPDVTPYETTWFPEDLADLQFKKAQNRPYWDDMNAVRAYFDTGDLYSGHIRFSGGGDRFFIEAPGLKTKEWYSGSHRVMLIHVDDKHYRSEIDAWHYPDQAPSVAFSRNIFMANKEVQAVDIVLDRSDSMYASITDNYLRNALKRNKDKLGFQSIIQTIQKKQDDIRLLSRNRSFIVQGCAGSGKTMVLLHRLRYLIYNKDIFSEDYYFLVPSTSFKKYIRDVATKFNINYSNILSYQGYYRFLLGKQDTTLSDEVSELVFSPEYLSRVYSKTFMQECYSNFFDLVIAQTNSLNEYSEERLNELIAAEETRVSKAIDSIRNRAVAAVIKRAHHIAKHLEIDISEYEHIPGLSAAMVSLIEQQKALVGKATIDEENIIIATDDPRILSDIKLQALTADVEAEAARVRKASIFTVNSHKKKHQQLMAKRDAYHHELMARIIEEEKQRLQEEAKQLSIVFGNITIRDIEAAYADVNTIFENAQQELHVENSNQQNIMEIIAAKHKGAIDALTQMIEASADIEEQIHGWVTRLQPAVDELQEYLRKGMNLYVAFSKFITDKKEQEAFREKHKIFARRTDREQQAYWNSLLMNICRRKIKEEFDIKICDVYKHYWYIAVYCSYLIYGNTSKAKPYLYIDEAQDLSISEMELIQKLNNNPIINLFGDINQVITPHGIRNWKSIQDSMEVLTLDENFRNTNQIVEFCNSVLPFRMQKIGVDMEPVEQIISVNQALNEQRIPQNATFIVKNSLIADDLRIALDGSPVTDYTIYTVKEAKGLEFRHVIVVERDMTNNEKYISYTRALAKLTVIYALPSFTDPNTRRIVEGEDLETA